jgi:acyl-CoA synthetase (AMP-forming)/AMP-acid ligase II
VVENLYGPTETTIAISNYRWNPASSAEECLNGIVPIGWIFSGQDCRVVADNGRSVGGGEIGQLCLGGSQVAAGYWNNADKTHQQFIRLPEDDANRVWYSTGDLVKQDQRKCLFYLGRTDHQVKIRGYRVELQEVDLVLRRACGTDQAVAVPWPVKEGTAEGLIAFVCAGEDGEGLDRTHIMETCRRSLPDYMVPNTVCFVPEIPLNENGKTDKRKLIAQFEGGHL